MKKIEIEIYDVLKDGFPTEEDNAVCFICDGDIFTGWPLIEDGGYEEGKYPDGFSTKKEAKEDPMGITWETSEFSGECLLVQYWFRRLEKLSE